MEPLATINYHPVLTPVFEGFSLGLWLEWFNDGYSVTSSHTLANRWRPETVEVVMIPEAATQRRIVPRSAILHTQAGPRKTTRLALWRFIARTDVTHEPHLLGPDMADGKVTQVVPFNVEAHSNYQGNSWAWSGQRYGSLSAETQDNGAATLDVTSWTVEQLRALVGWLTAVCAVYGIACTDVPVWNGSGIAPHNRHPEWSRGAHSCPGKARTLQMDWIRGEVAGRLAKFHAHVGTTCGGVGNVN